MPFVVGAFELHEVAQQMPTQAVSDAGPVFGIGRELAFLEPVDFVADEAGDRHGDFTCGDERSLGDESGECFGG